MNTKTNNNTLSGVITLIAAGTAPAHLIPGGTIVAGLAIMGGTAVWGVSRVIKHVHERKYAE